MILVLRRWFVPSERLDEFIGRWRNEIEPMIVKQPSVPIPKFAPACSTLRCELRNRRTLAIYDSSAALTRSSQSNSRQLWCELRVRGTRCVRAEAYQSSIRGHYVTSVVWADETSRMKALAALAGLYNEFRQYERFEPEVLTSLE